MKPSAWIVAVCLAVLGAGVTGAQERIAPLSRDRTITVVVGSGPGSSIDTMVRTFAEISAKHTDQKFIVDNRTGGAGIVATTHVLRQPADGFTVFGLTRSYTINFLTQPDMPNPLLRYHYVGLTMDSPVTIFTFKGSPYQDVKAMIADGKARAGEQTWGATFVGSVEWLITHSIWQRLGYKGKYIAFKDGGTLNTAIMGKHVSIGVGDMSDILGKEEILTPLVIASAQRHAAAPNVPTFRDIGYDIVEGNFRGFVARQEVPAPAKEFYDRLYARVLADPRWQKFLDDTLAQRPPLGGQEMERLAKQSAERALPLMREAGLVKPAK